MYEIYRKLFKSLHRDSYYTGRYVVLNDLNYVDSFYAASDDEAIEKFINEYLG